MAAFSEFALGCLRWSPQEFWDATMYDMVCGIKGYRAAKGLPDISASGRREYERLHQLVLEEREREQWLKNQKV